MKTKTPWYQTDAVCAVGILSALILAIVGVWLAQHYDLHAFRSRESMRQYNSQLILDELAAQRKLLEEIRDR